MVATALLLSACQPDRALSGWLAQPTASSPSARPEALTAPAHFVSGWVPYWGTTASRSAIINRSNSIGDVTPLFYGTNNDGTLRLLGPQAQLDATITATRNAGRPLIVGIFDSTGPGIMSGILDNPIARAAHIQEIVKLATTKLVDGSEWDGIDLDYEVFAFGTGQKLIWEQIEDDWVAFVNQLSIELHNRGKLLSVTVPPVWNNGNSGYWVYSQARIAAAVDRLRLMVYDYHTSTPGPISPMWWVRDVIRYSTSVVSPDKLQLGVPAYGRHWRTKKYASESCPDGATGTASVLMKNISSATAGQRSERDEESGELKYTWSAVVSGPRTKPLTPPVVPPSSIIIAEINAAATGSPLRPALRLSPSPWVTCTVQHTIFVPDEFSVDQRSDAAQLARWRGIVMWAFGYENLNMYDVLDE